MVNQRCRIALPADFTVDGVSINGAIGDLPLFTDDQKRSMGMDEDETVSYELVAS